MADDGAADPSAVSPYRIAPDGILHATQAAVPDGQTAACWISLAWNGDVFVDNAGSGTVAAYQASPGGRLTFLRNTSVGTGAVPLDNAVTSDDRDLYVLIRSVSAGWPYPASAGTLSSPPSGHRCCRLGQRASPPADGCLVDSRAGGFATSDRRSRRRPWRSPAYSAHRYP